MEVFLPATLQEALEIKAAHPEAVPIAGGTDLMVEMNFDRRRPEAMVDVSRLADLREWHREDGWLVLGSGVTYARIMRELPTFTALAQASRTVGSPQIRNRATVGGNLGTASPAGDALPVLAAHDAEILLGRAGSVEVERRSVPWREFLVGVKRTSATPEELILGARWRTTRGPGSFSKIGTRNAMVIAVANLCLVVDEDGRAVRVALGSVAPTVVRAQEGEAFASAAMEEAGAWDDPSADVSPAAVEEFGRLVAEAARPIDDVRGTAVYRRHACAVLARRAWTWALQDRRGAG
jgi:CO/xanthine dehydrogenase FAD-binding subunit